MSPRLTWWIMIYIGIEFGSEVLSRGHTILDQINTPSKNLHWCRVGYVLLLTVLVRKKRPDSAEDSDISFQFLCISFHKHIRKRTMAKKIIPRKGCWENAVPGSCYAISSAISPPRWPWIQHPQGRSATRWGVFSALYIQLVFPKKIYCIPGVNTDYKDILDLLGVGGMWGHI